MDGITILRRCRRYAEEAEGLRERIERRRALAQRMTASYQSTGGHGGAETDRMGAFVADMEQIEEQLERRNKRYDAERIAAVELMELMDARQARALELYYIDMMTMDGVAAAMGFSVQHARRLRKAAEAVLMDAGDVAHMLPEWYRREG